MGIRANSGIVSLLLRQFSDELDRVQDAADEPRRKANAKAKQEAMAAVFAALEAEAVQREKEELDAKREKEAEAEQGIFD